MGDTDDAVAWLKPGDGAADGNYFACRFAAELLRQRKGGTAGKLIAREIAGAVLHVPARHRGGVVLDQHVMLAQCRQIVFAKDQLVRRTVFEQAHGHGFCRDSHLSKIA